MLVAAAAAALRAQVGVVMEEVLLVLALVAEAVEGKR